MYCSLSHLLFSATTRTACPGTLRFKTHLRTVVRVYTSVATMSRDRWMPVRSPVPSIRSRSDIRMMQSRPSTLVAVAQMTSSSDLEANFATCAELVESAANLGAKMVFLPEGCDYIAETKQQSVELSESLQGATVNRFKELAAENNVWLSLGGIHTREENETKISNTHVVINDSGEIVSKYKKAHLFNVNIPERNVNLNESSYVDAGECIHSPVPTVAGMLGLGICYDMRFPELSIIQRRLGCEILTFPSAFTVPTGLAHWEPLLRARAIENQCYVVAAAQTGQHNTRRSSYGHAMIIDPWGAVVAQVSEGTGIALAEINPAYLIKVRQEMPVITHRRQDLYQSELLLLPETPHLMQLTSLPSNYASYVFGQVYVPGSCFFMKSSLSQAFVNKMPIKPGHCLITPEKPHKRLLDLTAIELCDLAQMVQFAEEVITEQHEVSSSQIAIQDGKYAGQTIEHIHVHIIPWQQENNISSDNGSISLENHEERNKARSLDQMSEEASQFRKVVQSLSCDLYDVISSDIPKLVEYENTIAGNTFDFDKFKIVSRDIILISESCYAFWAVNAILPNHAYVTFKKFKPTFNKLTPQEVCEFFQVIQEVQKMAEKSQETSSSTIVILNGKSAGQHIQQVHAHIIPRKEGDLIDNDSIYNQVQNHNLILSLPPTPQDKEQQVTREDSQTPIETDFV